MTQKNPSVYFYDSDFDSRNESLECDDGIDLNVAFRLSPEESISYMFDDSSLNCVDKMLVYNDEKDLKKVRDNKVNTIKVAGKRDNLKTINPFKTGSLERDLEPYSMTNPGYLSKNEINWVSSAKRYRLPRFGDLVSEMGNAEISETTDLPKRKEETECIFTSTCLGEFHKSFDECVWRKIEKRSFFEMDDESEKTMPKTEVPVPLSDYVYHELSTIPEVDSAFMDDSVESLMNSDKRDGFFMRDSNKSKVLKANDSSDIFMKANTPSNFPAYVMKLIQNEHIEKLLQEQGILEESDLTLITTDLDSLSTISEKSSKSHCHSCYNIKLFNDEASPSLISFEQHELSCMKDSFGE